VTATEVAVIAFAICFWIDAVTAMAVAVRFLFVCRCIDAVAGTAVAVTLLFVCLCIDPVTRTPSAVSACPISAPPNTGCGSVGNPSRGIRHSGVIRISNGCTDALPPPTTADPAAATSIIPNAHESDELIVNECVTDPEDADLDTRPLPACDVDDWFCAHDSVCVCADIDEPAPQPPIVMFPDMTPLRDAAPVVDDPLAPDDCTSGVVMSLPVNEMQPAVIALWFAPPGHRRVRDRRECSTPSSGLRRRKTADPRRARHGRLVDDARHRHAAVRDARTPSCRPC
jgi:hypothetical protein